MTEIDDARLGVLEEAVALLGRTYLSYEAPWGLQYRFNGKRQVSVYEPCDLDGHDSWVCIDTVELTNSELLRMSHGSYFHTLLTFEEACNRVGGHIRRYVAP